MLTKRSRHWSDEYQNHRIMRRIQNTRPWARMKRRRADRNAFTSPLSRNSATANAARRPPRRLRRTAAGHNGGEGFECNHQRPPTGMDRGAKAVTSMPIT